MKLKTFIQENELFLKNIMISTIIGFAASFLNYYFNVLLARGLPENAFGIYSSAIGIITLVQIPTLAVSSAVTKFVADHKNKGLKEFKKDLFRKFFFIAFVVSFIFFLLSSTISNISNIPQRYMLSLSTVVFLSFFDPLTKGLLYGLEKPNKGNLLSFIIAIFKILIGIVAVSLYKDSATLPILAHGIPIFLTGILLYPFIGNVKAKQDTKERINFKNILVYFLLFVFLSTPYTLDLSLVNPDFRPEYSALSLIGKIIYFASIMVATVMFSKITNIKKDKERKKIFTISICITLLMGMSLTLIYWLFPEVVISFVYGDKYPEIGRYLGMYGLGMTSYAATYLIYNYFIAKNFTKSTFWLIITTAIQIILFTIRNDSLESVVQNQVFIYILLFTGSMLLLLFENRKIFNMDDTGIEPVTSTM